MKRARVILADDHTLMLDALKKLIGTDYEVVGTFQDGQSLVASAAALSPDVVVLDIGMPRMNGLIAGELLKRAMPTVKLIYMTMNRHADLAAEAFQLGASGYLLKTSAGSELSHAIGEVLLGRTYVTPLLAKDDEPLSVRRLKLKKKQRRLTVRQKEVLQLLAEGRTMKEIAFLLNLSPRTVAFHKYSMMSLLEVKSSAELVQFAATNSMLAV